MTSARKHFATKYASSPNDHLDANGGVFNPFDIPEEAVTKDKEFGTVCAYVKERTPTIQGILYNNFLPLENTLLTAICND